MTAGRISLPSTYPLHPMEEFGRLSDGERDAVIKLVGKPHAVERGDTIRREGDPAAGFFLLSEGWVLASMLLPAGRRQVLTIHLPGDVLGTSSMSSDEAVETLTAITPAAVSAISLTDFGQVIQKHPRIAVSFLLSAQRERITLMDQLASVGRTRAEQRMAALLVDLTERLGPLQLAEHSTFDLPLTQEEIGDVLGLTAVHVNRTLKILEIDGLIARSGRCVSILAMDRLVELGGRPRRPVRSGLDWLPAR
ncbi:cAMP-binding domain of CRP or a regulatory subunit of cAMP-dependent protein kinases [Sphingomonas gellani]|uniref:cAMP-binding domain of CRP or a regulatory subunit of cAMP-dependent protein kinases n=1 Tax=Sphingomonas gellani TaxID=1166340 RepID=A0A1H8AR53_9SPHN|nr:cAMP-binding domain of CRP or a regulatory subunit of cAMP-dependent protein kinases [Sphingomonas gellani]